MGFGPSHFCKVCNKIETLFTHIFSYMHLFLLGLVIFAKFERKLKRYLHSFFYHMHLFSFWAQPVFFMKSKAKKPDGYISFFICAPLPHRMVTRPVISTLYQCWLSPSQPFDFDKNKKKAKKEIIYNKSIEYVYSNSKCMKIRNSFIYLVKKYYMFHEKLLRSDTHKR